MSQGEIEKNYPLFYKTCVYLQNRSPIYRDIFVMSEKIPVNYPVAEGLCADALAVCHGDWEEYVKWLDSLNFINKEFLELQVYLEQNKHYKYSTFAEVEKNVFHTESTEIEGVGYLKGLYMSEIFWVTHHRVLNFFLDAFVAKMPERGTCLEIPTGSGIFLGQFLSNRLGWGGAGVDLSDTAIILAGKLFAVKDLSDRITLIKKNINEYEPENKFDAIMCGEFLEHVEDPIVILKKLASLLAPQGKIFLTTVVWAAFIDHIYLYRNAEEIRLHIAESGLKIEKELIQNIFPRDAGKLEARDVALNYAAILSA